MMQPLIRLRTLILISLCCAAVSCCKSPPPPPEPPGLEKRIEDKAIASLDVFLDRGNAEQMEALRAFHEQGRDPGIASWSELVELWNRQPPLPATFALDQSIRIRLLEDDGFVADAREAYPPEGVVPEPVWVKGVLAGIESWLAREE